MGMTIVESTRAVIGGVDTHLDVHVAAAVDAVGGVLGVESFPTNEQGYRRLIEWLRALGPVTLVGVEGTGSYGAGPHALVAANRPSGRRGRSAEPPSTS